jgi:hypothetical protein
MAQYKKLERQAGQLSRPLLPSPPERTTPEIAALPAPTFLDEVAAVDQSKLKVQVAQDQVDLQERKIDMLDGLPNSEVPEAVLPHEEQVLEQLKNEVSRALADQQFAEAKLVQAQQDRQYQEYQHSVELNKRAIAIQQAQLQQAQQDQRRDEQEQNRAYQLAQVEAQMQTIESQLGELSAVLCPFPGVIRRVRYESQSDQNLIVVLSLVAELPNGSGSGAASPSPGGTN